MEFMNLQDFKDNPDKLFFTFMGEIEAPGPLSGLGKTLDAYDREHRILSGWSRFSSPTPVDIVKAGVQGKIAVKGCIKSCPPNQTVAAFGTQETTDTCTGFMP